jgi:DNA-binding NarL/FixJ family response regulator
VLVVDNHPLWRQTITAHLTHLGAGAIHQVATLAEARAHARATGPHGLAILDLHLPDGNGIDLITELHHHGWPRIVVLTSSDDPTAVQSALQEGAHACLLKSAFPQAATDTPHEPDSDPHPPNLTPILAIITQVASPAPNQLTPRQLQILQLVADGHSNNEISQTLNISPLTVKSHLSRIGEKLGAPDRVQMIARAIRTGIIY